MRRREFITFLGSAAAAWPLRAQAQQPVIGVLNSGPARLRPEQFDGFHRGLKEAGYVEGQNVSIAYLGADDKIDRLPSLAAELAGKNVAVILAAGGPVAALAAQSATAKIPIVFAAVSDPIKIGLVASFNRPGANVTGNAGLTIELDPKRLELLRELVPAAKVLGALVNPERPSAEVQLNALQVAADKMGCQLIVLKAANAADLDAVFATLVQKPVDALLVAADASFNNRREQIIEFAARQKVPAIYQWREFPAAGGLISYGSSLSDAYRQSGIYVGRILKGEKAADLPVTQPTRFELVINLKTAKALGLSVPPSLLTSADEVID
jgi:putative tryptophan/tyrosine transport system substrate-binding protein